MSEHAAQVGNRVVEEGFDIVLAGGCRQFFAPVLPHGIRGVHTVLYLQEPNRPLYEILPGAKPMSAQDAKWMRARERENAARCARILCNSKFSRESILRAYGIDPYVCYLGIDLEKFHPGTLPSKPQVVCVGSLIPAKRPEFVVETVGLLPLPRPKVLWIGNAQDPGYRAHIEQLAKKRGVELEVRILVTDDELVRELQTSRATVYAPRLEPFGYGPLEANACGVPVVGLAEGGVRETVAEGRSGFLVDTLADAADALHRILAAPESLRDSARTWAEEWSMDRAIDRLVGHLEEVESADFEWIGPLERRERRRSSILTEHPEGE
jgi:glycosyltransferase involved in cell wall biosynthesis